jgi:hypothetical protein
LNQFKTCPKGLARGKREPLISLRSDPSQAIRLALERSGCCIAAKSDGDVYGWLGKSKNNLTRNSFQSAGKHS